MYEKNRILSMKRMYWSRKIRDNKLIEQFKLFLLHVYEQRLDWPYIKGQTTNWRKFVYDKKDLLRHFGIVFDDYEFIWTHISLTFREVTPSAWLQYLRVFNDPVCPAEVKNMKRQRWLLSNAYNDRETVRLQHEIVATMEAAKKYTPEQKREALGFIGALADIALVGVALS